MQRAVAPRVCLGGKPSVLMSASHTVPCTWQSQQMTYPRDGWRCMTQRRQ
ncbi:conserved hypothetical protein [Xanthomonas campestris pv. raphani 756C]|nr:conserved hypothetical protein [Xanthomonas campestris pv. raphani 756C]